MNPISKAIEKMAYRHSVRDIFRDFVAMSAISLSNAVDRPQSQKREAEYMQIVKKYNKEEANEIACMFALTVMELEANPRDVLGETYMELDMGNDRTGQFFTPYHLSVMMAKMTAGDESDIIADKGYITVQEPAVGAGGMVIALAGELADQEINYQQAMHVTAVDVDPICVHMSYMQFSLLHIPAIVVHGNTLTLEQWGQWYTPAHIMGGWEWKLRARESVQAIAELLASVETVETYTDNRHEKKTVQEPVINLFDGVKVCTTSQPKHNVKQDAKLDDKPNPKPQGGGQQLTLF